MFRLKAYILEIAATGSISRAAANLFLSQPSLSASVKRLEQEIGEPLFDRSVHPLQPTACGREYLRAAETIAAAEAEFSTFLDEYHHLETGSLAVGGSNMNISFVLPPILQKYRAAYPKIKVDVVEGNIDVLRARLLEGKIDCIVDSFALEAPGFDAYLYRAENLLLAAPFKQTENTALAAYRLTAVDILANRHRLPEVPVLPLHLLGDAPFIMLTPETDTYGRAMRLCRADKYTPNVAFAINQQSTAYNMVCAGLGVTMVSDFLVQNSQPNANVCYYKLDPAASARSIRLYTKKGRRPTRALGALLGVIETLRDGEDANNAPQPVPPNGLL